MGEQTEVLARSQRRERLFSDLLPVGGPIALPRLPACRCAIAVVDRLEGRLPEDLVCVDRRERIGVLQVPAAWLVGGHWLHEVLSVPMSAHHVVLDRYAQSR